MHINVDKLKTYFIATKSHHVEKIVNFLNTKTDLHYIISSDKQEIINFAYDFDVFISYCCPYIVKVDDRKFYNYHPAPLDYKGLSVYADAIKNNVREWAVTLHRMTNEVDTGQIIEFIRFPIYEPCSTNELGTQAHAKLFHLFRTTIGRII